MAGEGGVDIDLYAQVDEFEPEVAGQVRFREDFKRGEVQNVHSLTSIEHADQMSLDTLR